MEMQDSMKCIHKQVTFTDQAQNTSCVEHILQGAWIYLSERSLF